MITKHLIYRAVSTISILCLLFPAAPASGSQDEKPESYAYEKKDTSGEEKKFILKLKEDKKKCDLAIENTRILLDRSRNKPYLPELYLRLAELYIEKSRVIYFLRKAESPKGSSSVKSLEHFESNTLKNQAIEIYHRILANFPDFQDLDKVHFFLAHEYRELGQIDDMVGQYRAIISRYKDSPYAAEAYLLLGDHFFNLSDLDMAQRHYEEVLTYPQSSAVALARYKLGWCYINRVDFQKAIKLFEESVTSLSDTSNLDIDTYKRVDVRTEALADMAYCYCECYKESSPQEAIAYFEKYAWSRPVYTLALEKLAYRYLIKNKWSHAAAIYRKLATLRSDVEKLLEYSRRIFECVQSLERFDDADQDVAIMVGALKAQKYSVHVPEEEKKKNLADFELYARDIITHLHHKAREKKSKEDFIRAADSYKAYLEFFDSSPVYHEMEANYAEALFSAQRFLEAGKQYEKCALAIPQKNRHRDECLYSAVLSYYRALKQKENLTYYEIASARGGLTACGQVYAADFPGSPRVSNVLFNVAWITYDQGKYDEAIAEFSRFIDRCPTGEEARAAVHLILDAYNLKEDYEGLVKYGHKVLKNQNIRDEELKAEVSGIVQAAESKIINSLTVSAVNDWDKGKGALARVADQQKGASMGEYALYALLLPSREKADLETLFNAGSELIVHYPSSAKMKETLSLLIDSSLRISQFRLLAQYLEEFGLRLPKESSSTDFLYQAARIREGLGHYDLANKDYQMILDRGGKSAGDREEILMSMADNAQKKGSREAALQVLKTCRNQLSPLGQMKADARMAELHAQAGEFDTAHTLAAKARKAYKPDMAGEVRTHMAAMEYSLLEKAFQDYMKLQLRGSIDTSLVAAKAKLLESLEKGYAGVIQYQSPEWALSACYRSYEIFREFERFLQESPLPDLSPEEKEQYRALLNQKAQGYGNKADEYHHACIEKAHSWAVCDPKLAPYFLDSAGRQPGGAGFSKARHPVEITSQWSKDETLRGIHQKLMQNPGDLTALVTLAETYREKGDIRLSILIARKTLDEAKTIDKAKAGNQQAVQARIYNALGVACLAIGEDSLAKDAFIKALALNAHHIGARINLAGLYQYYGHIDKARDLYQTLPDQARVEETEDVIHPQARESYYAYLRG